MGSVYKCFNLAWHILAPVLFHYCYKKKLSKEMGFVAQGVGLSFFEQTAVGQNSYMCDAK